MAFFNKLRNESIGKNFGKYILYAIGEIILVVAGILIAISLNNLNSRNIISSENSKKINDLQITLNNKQHYFYPLYKSFEGYERFVSNYIIDTIPKNPQRKKYIHYYLTNRVGIDIINSNLFNDILINKGKFPSEKYGKLLNHLEYLQKIFVSISEEIDELESLNKKIIENITYEGKINFSDRNSSEIDDYFEDNPVVLNQMRLEYLSIQRIKSGLDYMNTVNICLQIESSFAEYGTSIKTMDSIFKSYQFTKLKPLRDTSRIEKTGDKPCMTAFYNNTNERLRVYTDKNRTETGIFIQPHDFSFNIYPENKLLYVFNDSHTELIGSYEIKYDSYFVID